MISVHNHYCPHCGEEWDMLFKESVCDVCLEEVTDYMDKLYDDNIRNN